MSNDHDRHQRKALQWAVDVYGASRSTQVTLSASRVAPDVESSALGRPATDQQLWLEAPTWIVDDELWRPIEPVLPLYRGAWSPPPQQARS
jgi:hypothetical protein